MNEYSNGSSRCYRKKKVFSKKIIVLLQLFFTLSENEYEWDVIYVMSQNHLTL